MRHPSSPEPPAAAIPAEVYLLRRVREVFAALPEHGRFVEEWPPESASGAAAAGDGGGGLAVLRWLEAAIDAMPARSAGLADALRRAAPALFWRQTYQPGEIGGDFLDNYGWTELVGPRGMQQSEQIACGILLLGPHTRYPRHRHPAEEWYLPLSGTAAWQRGDEGWRERPPGTAIHHRRDEPHAMRTKEQPLLALYVWCGRDIAQKSRLDPVVD